MTDLHNVATSLRPGKPRKSEPARPKLRRRTITFTPELDANLGQALETNSHIPEAEIIRMAVAAGLEYLPTRINHPIYGPPECGCGTCL